MTRISIVGMPGSGKSTLTNRLSKKLNIPAIYLDKYFHDKDWNERYSREEFKKVAEEFAKADNWIIDGNYRSSIDDRFEKADIIILLECPKWKSLFRVIKRAFNRGQPFDKTEGAKEKTGFKLIRYIMRYPLSEIREKVYKYKNIKKVYIAKNQADVERIYDMI